MNDWRAVKWSLPEEQQPQGYQPLATLFLKDLLYVPEAFQSVAFMCISMFWII
ncbi:hypothetical protein [Lysinibacillus macroides]|uniref:hypothetical protein n=1 Tax=Lysinibacillus macroides TaxID=33935 RepID=UPI000AB38EC0|nr:hypothetical protein [Lysinibacillus macroides]